MSQTEPTRQSDEILPPIIGDSTHAPIAIAVTSVVTVVDLTTLANTAALPPSTVKGMENTNPLGQYVTLVPTANVNVAFCATLALAQAVSATATTTISATGVITPSPTVAPQLPGPGRYDFRLPPGSTVDSTGKTVGHGTQSSARFLAAITPAGQTATLYVWVSSR